MLHPLSGSITGTGRAGYAALFNFIFTVRVLYCFLRREQALLTVGLKNLSHNAVLLFMICFCFDVAAFAVYVQSAIRPVESKLSPAVSIFVRAWLSIFRNSPCRHLTSASLLFDVAAFAVYVQSAIRPVESKLSPAIYHPVRAWLSIFSNSPCRHLTSASLLFDVAAFAVYVQSAIRPVESKLSPAVCHPVRAWLIANAQKKPPVFSDKRKSQQHKLPSVCSFQNARKHTWIQMSTWSGLEKAHINKPFSFISCGHNHPNNISRVICIAGCIA